MWLKCFLKKIKHIKIILYLSSMMNILKRSRSEEGWCVEKELVTQSTSDSFDP